MVSYLPEIRAGMALLLAFCAMVQDLRNFKIGNRQILVGLLGAAGCMAYEWMMGGVCAEQLTAGCRIWAITKEGAALMEHNVVVRMAKVLYGMVLAVFVFNLLVLPLVPGYTMMAYEGMGMGHPSISSLMGTMRSLLGAGVPAWEILVVRPLAMLGGDWSGYGPEVWWSAAFFLGCGICTAVLLWQARCILSTIIAQTPFQRSNARSMKRAAASCWGIALLAAVRMAVWFLRLRSAAPLFTFTALFIPVSLMAGLLFLVMSALFRQAAELKEDQDLTI